MTKKAWAQQGERWYYLGALILTLLSLGWNFYSGLNNRLLREETRQSIDSLRVDWSNMERHDKETLENITSQLKNMRLLYDSITNQRSETTSAKIFPKSSN
jgi:hypothetical protein